MLHRLSIRGCVAGLLLFSNIGLLAERSQVLIPMDGTWRYDSTGIPPATEWRNPGFNDSAWSSGRALLGFETNEVYTEPIRTELNLVSPGGTNRVLTYYFRSVFQAPTNLAGVRLFAGVLVDDGALFYLNGTEVGRVRIENPNQDPNQLYESYYEVFEFSPAALVGGENILGVEVRQGNATSSDVMFGMTLVAVWPEPIQILSGPSIEGGFLARPTSLRVWAMGSQPSFQWLKNGVPVAGATSDYYLINPTESSHAGDYSVVISNTLGTVVSDVVTLGPQPHPSTTMPPIMVEAEIATSISNGIIVAFSERVLRNSSTNIANYSVTANGRPVTITNIEYNSASLDMVRLRMAEPWQAGRIYRVTVQGVHDLSTNVMASAQQTNVYVPGPLTIPLSQPWRFWARPLYGDLSYQWTEVNYDDSSWSEPFPGGLSSSNVSGWMSPVLPFSRTIYFRTTFSLPPNIPGGARLRIQGPGSVGDAAIFYLNGARISSGRMKSQPPLSYNDFAGDRQGAVPPGFISAGPPIEIERADLLRPGTNVLAAELHQPSNETHFTNPGGTPFRPTLAFSASLEGWYHPGRQIGPLTCVREGSDLVLSWPDPDAEIQTAADLSGPWQSETTTGQTHRHSLVNGTKFFRLKERQP